MISDDYSNDKADRLLPGAPLQGDRSSWRESKSSILSYRSPGKRETFQVTITMAAFRNGAKIGRVWEGFMPERRSRIEVGVETGVSIPDNILILQKLGLLSSQTACF